MCRYHPEKPEYSPVGRLGLEQPIGEWNGLLKSAVLSFLIFSEYYTRPVAGKRTWGGVFGNEHGVSQRYRVLQMLFLRLHQNYTFRRMHTLHVFRRWSQREISLFSSSIVQYDVIQFIFELLAKIYYTTPHLLWFTLWFYYYLRDCQLCPNVLSDLIMAIPVGYCFKKLCVIIVKFLPPERMWKTKRTNIIKNIKCNLLFHLNTGHYPCCGEKAFRFKLIKYPVVRYVFKAIKIFTN